MKNKILALSFIVLLMSISVASVSFTQAATSQGWITDFRIEDNKTGQLLMDGDLSTGVNTSYAPVLPGAEIKVTFTVNVFTAGDGNLKLGTSLSRALQDKYWELVTQDYTLGSDFNPNSQSAEFNWVEGTFSMIVYGKVPNSVSTAPTAVNVVSLYGPTSGVALAQIRVLPTTAQMDEFLTLYDQKQAALKSLSGVDSGYVEIYTNVLNASKAIANNGNVEDAIALLNGLSTANAPASSTVQMLFYPIIGVTAALAVVFLVLFLRVRGKVSYFQLVVEDQIKDLEGLTLRASKIDRAMSSNLESVKDRLKRLVGM